jgi:hypothetical protein
MLTEDKVIDLLNSEFNFKKQQDRYCRFDALDEEEGVMLEVKCRKTHYDDTLLEHKKFEWNKEFATDNDYIFLYAVSMPNKEGGDTVYIFDPVALESEGYNFKWHTRRLPSHTDFGGWEWIDKEVGYLHIDDASIVYPHPENKEEVDF